MSGNSEETGLINTHGHKQPYKVRFWLAVLVGVGLLVAVVALAIRGTSSSNSNNGSNVCARAAATGSRAMVSTTHHLATQAGLDILRKGGNAFDAAAAVQWALAVVQPQSCGIGGGAFVVGYRAPNRTQSGGSVNEKPVLTEQGLQWSDGSLLFTLDGREEAPALFNTTSFCMNATCKYDPDCDCSSGAWPMAERNTGGHSAGVPGIFAVFDRLLRDHGTMNFAQTMETSIGYARNGFTVYPSFRAAILNLKDTLRRFNASRDLYLTNNGDAPELGTIWKNPDIATTLELLASQGPEVFYNGSLADEVLLAAQQAVNHVTGLGGVLRKEDFQGYRAVYRAPISYSYRNLSVYGMNAPASGGMTSALMLHQLQNFDLSSLIPGSAQYQALMIDVQDIAFADRNKYMGDADFTDVPVDGLLNATYATQRYAQFANPLRSARTLAGGTIPAGTPPGISPEDAAKLHQAPHQEEHGTSHYVIVDEWGNIASVTTTVEAALGCKVVVPGRGFVLNNELTDFTALPADPATGLPYANRPEGGKKARRSALGSDATTLGGKRPMSSMTPTIVFRSNPSTGEKEPYVAIGAPGGANIIAATMYGLLGIVDNNMCATDAIDVPRAISQNTLTKLEPPIYNNTKVLSFLDSHGYQYQDRSVADYYARVEAVVWRRPSDANPRATYSYLEGGADVIRESVAWAEGY